MSSLHLLRVAVWREIYSRRKAFVVTTAIALVLVVGGLLVASMAISDDGEPSVSVGVVGQDGEELEGAIEDRLAPGTKVEVDRISSVEEGEEALREGSISALVIDDYNVIWGQGTPGWMADTVAASMWAVNVARVSADLGLSESEVGLLLTPVSGETIDYEERDEAVEVMAVITVIVMFVAILAYGQWIAYGVVEEKANRVAELILGAISPSQLLTAKMISLGGIGLVQLVIVGAAGLLTGRLLTDIEIPAFAGAAWVWLLFWFLIGYGFYASLYAAAGSLAADSQEAGSVITPLNILPGIGYMVGVIAFSAGAEGLLRTLSLIPLWSPLLMPGRMAQGTAEPWEVVLAATLMILTSVVVIRLAARVYLGGITQATRQVGWRQAFRGGQDLASES